MEARASRPMGLGVILGLIGGAALVIGSFLTWVTVSLDIQKFAQILGVDPSALAAATGSTTFSAAGTHGDGKITLVMGLLVIVGAILVIAKTAKKAGYAVVAIAGVIGTAICVYEIASKSSQINDALSNAGPALAAAGITTDTLKTIFNVSWGIGLWVCLAGGVVALVGGVIGLMSKSEPDLSATPMAGTAMAGGTAMGSPVNSGFDAPAAPAAPAPPVTDVAPPPEATPSEATPPAPSSEDTGSGTGVDQPTD